MFRYPGGKGKLKSYIIKVIKKYYNRYDCYSDCVYCEPFMGAGAICLSFLKECDKLKKICINDYDIGISCFWDSVINNPHELCKMVDEFNPSVQIFYEYKENLLSHSKLPSNMPPVLMGFMKMAIHQISYSGLGTKSGGPLGGIDQKSKYNVSCRWNPETIKAKILKNHKILSKREISEATCRNSDFEDVIEDMNKQKSFLYLDPPYYEKGEELYQFSFSSRDHKRLASSLLNRNNSKDDRDFPWILSYDNSPMIRQFYDGFCHIKEINVKCTINTKKGSYTKKEILIIPKKFQWLFEEKNDMIDFDWE